MLSFLLNCKRIYNDFIKDEVTVYAAQASFFIVLSAAPFIMILLTLIQLIPAAIFLSSRGAAVPDQL